MHNQRPIYAFFVLLIGFIYQGRAQITDLSPVAKISVITCGSGSDLYTTFGHSAFRVVDVAQELDVVYNYGTFDFDPPGFYVDFAKGKLDYKLSKQSYPRFLFTYELEQRWVKEQVLVLHPDQKSTLYHFLEKNNLPENRMYPYDFFYDNCATKIRDVLTAALGSSVVYDPSYVSDLYTFRELIHKNVNINSWSAVGIDIALGAVIDTEASSTEHMFLPDYVHAQLQKTTLDGVPLVADENVLLAIDPLEDASSFFTTPLCFLLLVLGVVVYFSLREYNTKKRARWLDFALFLSTGAIGILIIFLWFFTNHTATARNFNFLWAFAPNLIVAFFLAWLVGVQAFNIVLLPLFIALTIRYWMLYRNFPSKPTLI